MLDNEVEKELNFRPGCPACQAEVQKAVALSIAYYATPALDPSMSPLLEAMEDQADLLNEIQARCCCGGN